MAYFIGDLDKRAAECRLEKDFKFFKARRHRQAIDEAIQRYRRMTAPIPSVATPNSARRRTLGFITSFISALQPVLPCFDAADITESAGSAVDWKKRLDQCAKIVDDMVKNLAPIHSELTRILKEKTAISNQIQVSLGQMADIV